MEDEELQSWLELLAESTNERGSAMCRFLQLLCSGLRGWGVAASLLAIPGFIRAVKIFLNNDE